MCRLRPSSSRGRSFRCGQAQCPSCRIGRAARCTPLAPSIETGPAPSPERRSPMPRQTAADFAPEVLQLFDQYVHGASRPPRLPRRRAQVRRRRHDGGGLLEALSPNFAEAQQVATDDPRIAAEHVEFDSPQGYGKVRGYLVKPAKAAGKLPRRARRSTRTAGSTRTSRTSRAASRSRATSRSRPTRCSRSAATRATRTRRASCSRKLDQAKRARTSSPPRAASRRAPDVQRPDRRGRLLLGRRHGQLPRHAVARPRRRRAVLRHRAALEDVPKIKAPLLLHFADNDERINAPGRPTRPR